MKTFVIYPIGSHGEYKSLLIRLFYSPDSDPYTTSTKRVDLTWQGNKGEPDFYGFTIDASIQDAETGKLVSSVCKLFEKNDIFFYSRSTPENIVTCLLETGWKQSVIENNSSKFLPIENLDIAEIAVYNVIDPKKPDQVYMSIVAESEKQAKKKAFDYLIDHVPALATNFNLIKSGPINYIGTLLPIDSFLESIPA